MQKKDKRDWKQMKQDDYKTKLEDQPNKQEFMNLNLKDRFQKQEGQRKKQQNQKFNFKECHNTMVILSKIIVAKFIKIKNNMDQMH